MKKILLALIFTIAAWADGIYATFSVVPLKVANLAFNSSGLVAKIYVDIRSSVEKNQKLAELENSDLKAMLAKARASFNFAKKSYNRAMQSKSVQNAATLDKFEFNFKVAKANLALSKANLEKSILKAPFSGIITDKRVELGDVVSAMAPRMLFRLESHKKKLLLEFDQNYINKVKVGDIFDYKLDGSSKTYRGKISKIYPSVDAKNHSAKAEVVGVELPSGLFGDGYIKGN